VFLVAMGFQSLQKDAEKNKDADKMKQIMETEEAQLLQVELYGEKALLRLQHQNSSSSVKKTMHSSSSDDLAEDDVVEKKYWKSSYVVEEA
jgi:hypothetical protein